jgi:L-alanine-DL-glutamate epimerase-like enolase superfamily enzyme
MAPMDECKRCLRVGQPIARDECEPLFNERLAIADGRMTVPSRAGLGFSLSEQARRWAAQATVFGKRP